MYNVFKLAGKASDTNKRNKDKGKEGDALEMLIMNFLEIMSHGYWRIVLAGRLRNTVKVAGTALVAAFVIALPVR